MDIALGEKHALCNLKDFPPNKNMCQEPQVLSETNHEGQKFLAKVLSAAVDDTRPVQLFQKTDTVTSVYISYHNVSHRIVWKYLHFNMLLILGTEDT